MLRIQRIIAQSGLASRRKAEILIANEQVLVNGQIAKLGDKASPQDVIVVNGKVLAPPAQLIYYVLNKPMQTITTLDDPQGRQTVRDLIITTKKIFPIGRLDYNTTGTLLLTNDGNFAYKLTHPSFEIDRVYRARLHQPLTRNELITLNGTMMINGQPSHQKVQKVDTKSYVITLHQGSYHHIKKLFAHVNKKVTNLTRISFAGITTKGLVRGANRKLKPYEIKQLKMLVQSKN